MNETRPLQASIIGILAILCGWFAWRGQVSEFARLALASVAIVCSVYYLFWLIDVFNLLLFRMLGNARAAWYAPVTRQLELIRHMTPVQLAAVGQGMVRVKKLPTNAGLITRYSAPGMVNDLDADTVRSWVDYCVDWPKFPELPPQHGLPQNLERAELQAFTAMVVTLGIADAPQGSRPARWRVGARAIYERLEL